MITKVEETMTILINTIAVFNRTLEQTEERIKELQDRSLEIILSEDRNEIKKSGERIWIMRHHQKRQHMNYGNTRIRRESKGKYF